MYVTPRQPQMAARGRALSVRGKVLKPVHVDQLPPNLVRVAKPGGARGGKSKIIFIKGPGELPKPVIKVRESRQKQVEVDDPVPEVTTEHEEPEEKRQRLEGGQPEGQNQRAEQVIMIAQEISSL